MTQMVQLSESQEKHYRDILSSLRVSSVSPLSIGKESDNGKYFIKWVYCFGHYQGRDVFVKILGDERKRKDFISQIEFFSILKKNNYTFVTPNLLDYSAQDENPYYIVEKIEGELLGNYLFADTHYAQSELWNTLVQGLPEINTLQLSNVWQKSKDIQWLHQQLVQMVEDERVMPFIKAREIASVSSMCKLLKEEQTVALWGDPGPNNFIVTKGKDRAIAIIDFTPFMCGYAIAERAEFDSFFVFDPAWKKITGNQIDNSNNTYLAFRYLFLLKRVISAVHLERKGGLHKPLSYYIEMLKKELYDCYNVLVNKST